MQGLGDTPKLKFIIHALVAQPPSTAHLKHVYHTLTLLIVSPDLVHLLFEWFQRHLQSRTRKSNLKLFQYVRVQDAQNSNYSVIYCALRRLLES